MARTVHCVKLDKDDPCLDYAPYPGDLGKRIYDNISQEAWQGWLQFQTILMNENRLSPIEPRAREFLEKEMDKYFFGEGSEMPEGYVPPNEQQGY